MPDIKLFRLNNTTATEIPGQAAVLERSLQTLIESNLTSILGVRYLGSEQSTGRVHKGRIDTLGIDENCFPVIVEYKRATNENVINQGLFYLDWLLDHRADFKWMVLEKFGKDEAEKIDWTAPRLICIAADFTNYDLHAVQQIDRNIDLIRYRRFGPDLLALELVHTVTGSQIEADPEEPAKVSTAGKNRKKDKRVAQSIADLDPTMRDLYESVRAYVLALGDDVTEKMTEVYVAFRRIKNFITVTISNKQTICLYLKLEPTPERLKQYSGLSRDMRNKGHWGTGDLEISLTSAAEFERVKPLLQMAYSG